MFLSWQKPRKESSSPAPLSLPHRFPPSLLNQLHPLLSNDGQLLMDFTVSPVITTHVDIASLPGDRERGGNGESSGNCDRDGNGESWLNKGSAEHVI